FPQTQFHFVNAGISSTCSTTGAFRLHRDVLSKKPDLVLIEFAVNDDQDAAHSREACIRGMEGIIRNARVNHPQADLLVTYFINPPMLETWQKGERPLTVDAHESVMRHYGVSSVWLAKEIADRIKTSKLTWKDYGGTHPAPTGNQIAANLVQQLLTTAWDLNPSLGIDPSRSARPSLPKPMDQKSYQSGNMQTISDAELDDHWKINVPNWKTIQGGMRSRFANELILSASTVGAEMKLDFKGTAIGLYILAGPDAGAVEYQIDDQPVQTKDLYHRFSKGLHYPRTVILDDQLSEGSHRISIRVTEASDRKNSGTAVRIMAFATNGHP
ncbi:MAG: SGNH/GDSL hydrolase family protein, partial [Rubripirellula sp.]